MMKKRSLGLLGWPLWAELEAQVMVSIKVLQQLLGQASCHVLATGVCWCVLVVCVTGRCFHPASPGTRPAVLPLLSHSPEEVAWVQFNHNLSEILFSLIWHRVKLDTLELVGFSLHQAHLHSDQCSAATTARLLAQDSDSRTADLCLECLVL